MKGREWLRRKERRGEERRAGVLESGEREGERGRLADDKGK